MNHFIAIDVQDQLGNIYLTCASMRVAFRFCKLHNLQIIDKDLVPELDDDGEFTNQNILIITVQDDSHTTYEDELMPDNSHYEGDWEPYRSNNR